MQAIIITSRVSFYREFNDLSDDTKHASILTEIREQLLIKLRFPNFFWAVYIVTHGIKMYVQYHTRAFPMAIFVAMGVGERGGGGGGGGGGGS